MLNDANRKKDLLKLMTRLENLYDDLRSDFLDIADDLDDANSFADMMEMEANEKDIALRQSEKEIRMLITWMVDHGLSLPMQGHYININEYIRADDPAHGCYEWDDGGVS